MSRVPLSGASASETGKGCWYFTSYVDCPVCGRGETTRERRYSPKPADPNERFEWLEIYDHCNYA